MIKMELVLFSESHSASFKSEVLSEAEEYQ